MIGAKMSGTKGADRFLMVEGHRFHLVEWGRETLPKLVMLHGGGSSAHGTWDETAPDFLDRFHIVALDQRGHGESEWDPQARYRVSQYATDTQRVLESIGWSRFDLIGHSMGGAIALVLAARNPRMVSHLVLIDSSPRVPNPSAAPRRNTIGDRPLSFPTRSDAEAYARAMLPEDARDRPLDYGFIERDGAWTWRTDVAGMKRAAQQVDGQPQGGLWPELESLRCPTVVLRSGRPQSISDESVAQVLATNSRVRVVDYPNANHWLHQSERERFTKETGEFLAGG